LEISGNADLTHLKPIGVLKQRLLIEIYFFNLYQFTDEQTDRQTGGKTKFHSQFSWLRLHFPFSFFSPIELGSLSCGKKTFKLSQRNPN
jgi:hypothetical protein